jgi:ATP/maltotriose-dependent transcriptional regulator MalT
MGLDLEASAIAALEERTEGWIAGLQLAALSLQGRADISGFLVAFSGTHRYVLDYLSEEVLAQQSETVQQFLLHTCILERLNGSLCDAVTERQESQAMLEALERANLFVVELDDERSWYRYHHLFAQALRSHLQQREPTLPPDLHRHASAWYEQHELPVEAIQHAPTILGYVHTIRGVIARFSGDIPHAASLARQALYLLPETEMYPRAGAIFYKVSSERLKRRMPRFCRKSLTWKYYTPCLPASITFLGGETCCVSGTSWMRLNSTWCKAWH